MQSAFAFVALCTALAAAKNTVSPFWGEYNTTSGPIAGKINVHLVPHSHDDTGWLLSVDQYFQGEVAYILDTVLDRLVENPDRKFMFVETGFFERWWIQQSPETQTKFRKVVASGQLEFINGGWCMHDEAAPHYVEMVENTARGHQFLLKTFGVVPKGTWQIDPFGHTNTQGWLIGQYAGLQFLYFGRMDYQDFNMRKNLSTFVAPGVPKSIEWVWQGSKTFGSQYQTFTGELYGDGSGGYGPPDGMDFDGNDFSAQVQDDPRFHDYNLDQFVAQFINNAVQQAQNTRTEHIIWAMGSDFNYQNADHWYKNIDKLIHHVNLNGTVNAFYSTPSIYTEQKNAANLTWEARFDDVMPLADNANHYWTGYFTSRPGLKRYLRVLSNYLQTARQLALLTPTQKCTTTGNTLALCTDALEAGIAITTHHDGLSGTEKQAVSDDYAMRMAEGEFVARGMVHEALMKTVGLADVTECSGHLGLNISFCPFSVNTSTFTVVAYNSRGMAATQPLRIPVGPGSYVVTDATGVAITAQLVPITDRDRSLSLMYLQFPEMSDPAKVAAYTNTATNVLVFPATMPAVGWTTFTVSKTSAITPSKNGHSVTVSRIAALSKTQPAASAPITISNDLYTVTLDPATGTISNILNLASGVSADVSMDIGFYNSSIGGCTAGVNSWAKQRAQRKVPGGSRDRREAFETGMDSPVLLKPETADDSVEDSEFGCDGQPSGAYIFRPNSSYVFPAACSSDFAGSNDCSVPPTFQIVTGPLVQEAYITFNDWATVVVRLTRGVAAVEVEYTVGPIPQYGIADVTDHTLLGKEVVLRFNSSLQSQGTVYFDSNAREMVRRDFNLRGPAYPVPYQISEPVAGNFYPVNTVASLEDEAAGVSLHVVVDRAMGAASLANGEVEVMVHRRVQQDDNRGVGQPLNETMCGCRDQDQNTIGQCPCVGLTVRGNMLVVLDSTAAANQARRELAETLSFGAVVALSQSTPATPAFSAVSNDLPPNIKLMTLGVVSPQYQNGTYVRLAHLYEAGEHPTLSLVTNVSLTSVFAQKGMTITSAKEVSLTGNRSPSDLAKAKMTWKVAGEAEQMPKVAGCAAGKSCVPEMVPFDPFDAALTVTLRPMDIRTFIVVFA